MRLTRLAQCLTDNSHQIVTKWISTHSSQLPQPWHVFYLASQGATVWTQRREWPPHTVGVGCVRKASSRTILELSQWESAWWRLMGERWQVLPAVTAAWMKGPVARIMWKKDKLGLSLAWGISLFGPTSFVFLLFHLVVGVISLPVWLTLNSEQVKAQNGPFLQYCQDYVLLISACIDTDVQP